MFKLRSRNGLTFIELLVIVVVVTFGFSGVLYFFILQNQNATQLKEIAEMQSKLKVTSDLLTKGISPAGYRISNSRNIIAISDSTIQVRFLDEHGHYGCKGRVATLSYHLVSDTLWQKSNCGWKIKSKHIATGIRSLKFSYYDMNDNPVKNPAHVRVICFTLELKQGLFSRQKEPIRLTTSVIPSNLLGIKKSKGNTG